MTIVFCVFIVVFTTGCNQNESRSSLEQQTYTQLETVLQQRKNALTNYLDDIKQDARKVVSDSVMLTFFSAKKDYYLLSQEMAMPSEVVNSITRLKKQIQQHYLHHYLAFYDILFIDNKGDIFYTIRKEKDYHQNIFSGKLAQTKLSEKLVNYPSESYVDFQFYEFSGEPSAFFIEPVILNGKYEGWFVFQFSLNKINHIFEKHDKLGKTGEVILVNQQHYLLSNSRFNVHNVALKEKLSKENIEAKFKARKGYKCVTDYRGFEVFTSFEVFPYFDTEWLIIAKKDKKEIINTLYKSNSGEYIIADKSILNPIKTEQIDTSISFIRVDMDEYLRTDSTIGLFTQGVSTCTAISIHYSKHFSYLAHISSYDKIYNKNRTDILGQLLSKLTYFDVTESEKPMLEFHIIGSNKTAIKNCIDRILQEGYFLSQIKISSNNKATYANMYHRCDNGKTFVEWIYQNNNSNTIWELINNKQPFSSLITIN